MVPDAAGTLPNILAFCRTIELGSFTRAAVALGVTPQATSRAVARLEAALGVTLFRRTTRSLEATEAAHAYYAACQAALAALSEAERGLAGSQRATAGRVRVSVPTTYGHHRFLPMLVEFRRLFPRVEVEVHVSNRSIDFVRESFDFAIRLGAITDASLVARRLGDFTVGVFGSPGYLAARGTPATPADLAAHQCITFAMPRTGRVLPWDFRGEPRQWVPPTSVQVDDDVLATITLARGGGGLVQTYHFFVERELARGELVEVLREFGGVARRFSLIYPANVRLGRPARALIDFVVKAAARDMAAPRVEPPR